MKTKVLILCMYVLVAVYQNISYANEPLNNTIQLNQVGFTPNSTKLAIVKNKMAKNFTVVDVNNNKPVYEGRLEKSKKWPYSGEIVKVADFSDYNIGGTYAIKLDVGIVSSPFIIADSIYASTLFKSTKAYYLNRAGTPIKQEHAGQYARPSSHPDNIVYIHSSASSKERPENSVISASKGWFDAGDYNKYIVNSNITVHTLLAALEDNSAVFNKLDLNIPESKNGLPDLVDEIIWNLDWMLSMQDPHDGGIYHKLTTKNFTPFGGAMAHEQNQDRYVVSKSITASLGFAAVMAQASRVLKPYQDNLPGYSERLLIAAKAAWEWSKQNPEQRYVQPSDIKTGIYENKNEPIEDELSWASSELFSATGEPHFINDFAIYKTIDAPSWSDVQALALIALSKSTYTPNDLKQTVKRRLVDLAERWISIDSSSAYRLAITEKDFVWGSNAVVLNKAFILLRLNKIKKDKRYQNVAQSLLDYVLGRNPLGVSYITGVGHKPVINIHHRISVTDNILEPMPGLLSGGPHSGQQDKNDCKREGVSYPSSLPALSFLEHTCSYATNEIAINWNAPLVYVLSSIR